MFRDIETAAALTGYTPTEEDLRGLREWFETYDARSADPTPENVERMADMAVFPLNLVTDGSDGEPWTGQWDRERYVRTMNAVLGGTTGGDLSFESVRTPLFLSPSMVVVFSSSVMRAGGEEHRMNYADILVRQEGRWVFQTMAQRGWADMLREQEKEQEQGQVG
ncbi:nuclear transport factor 2 family protein [Streptomyces sp. TRM 70361]|uniref:nuclear transport factor 2 family protein n=1 Tax=Streptomyces sp. TRM 70361 TaxID=3116553 RepID=UPI002E7C07BC|nr:nuclear transport factor 2 family protein [Streptomyces sp. TRM 70361]MEE1941037.1 nuclear transport factor 2 family protein [Streptomyces sp. TRM 70361]